VHSDSQIGQVPKGFDAFFTKGVFWLVVAVVAAFLFFQEGIDALLKAWQTPEYSHGPLIPVLSGLLFLRHLKSVPVNDGPVDTRLPGFAVLVFAVLMAAFGRLIQIADIVAYGLILWVGALLLISFGWKTGRQFWPPVLHLVYMLPLPGALYYGLSTQLQFISSEIGVWFLRLLNVPVFLDGNIIDMGVYKLHVAEACSGLRYLFPILSFSYIFAVLYRGPMWHKAVLLLSAVPITVLMNSIRIGIAGYIVNNFGLDWVEGFSHFFEGWVIFISCVALLFLLARVMLFFHPSKMGLAEALDLDTSGLGTQMMRLQFIRPSAALVAGALMMAGITVFWGVVEPQREAVVINRDPFVLFPREIGDWQSGAPQSLESSVARVLGADDYHAVSLTRSDAAARVDLFMAWYKDRSRGGTHSPEVCLPAGGWEIAEIESQNVAYDTVPGGVFSLNRTIIQKGVDRMLVYYWYEHRGQRTASDFTAKLHILMGTVLAGRQDSAIVRLITPILPDETELDAAARLEDVMAPLLEKLPRFIPWK